MPEQKMTVVRGLELGSEGRGEIAIFLLQNFLQLV